VQNALQHKPRSLKRTNPFSPRRPVKRRLLTENNNNSQNWLLSCQIGARLSVRSDPPILGTRVAASIQTQIGSRKDHQESLTDQYGSAVQRSQSHCPQTKITEKNKEHHSQGCSDRIELTHTTHTCKHVNSKFLGSLSEPMHQLRKLPISKMSHREQWTLLQAAAFAAAGSLALRCTCRDTTDQDVS